ncbi:MAG: hypothetical protein U1C33_08820, partial [Candidatus Cloacimonadaceae bacterium]|nr:hypothetical protein [Candidatus Cloacimonadaceae bacterium]
MVRHCLIILLITFCQWAGATDLLLPELHQEEYQEIFWDSPAPVDTTKLPVTDRKPTPLNISLRSTYHIDSLSPAASLLATQRMYLNHNNMHVSGTQQWEPEKGRSHNKLNLTFTSKDKYQPELSFGSYRAQFGKGLVLGWTRNSQAAFGLAAPGNPKRYSPLGVAGKVQLKRINIFAMGSAQKREAHFSDDMISSLYTYEGRRLAHTAEDIHAIGLGYVVPKTQVAILYYHQDYDHAFCDSKHPPIKDALSLYANQDLQQL